MLTAFLLPVLINFVHAAEGHNHFDNCTESDIHVHKSKIDCDIDDMQMVDAEFYAFAKAYTLYSPTFKQTKSLSPTSSYTQIAINVSDRGPPSSC